MAEKKKLSSVLINGVLKENPVLVLILGTCPTLAISTSVVNALGMGVAATVVLACSNTVISALRKLIPDKVRIPAFITIIAGFVTMVQMLLKAFLPAIDEALGIYLPLIVVNCIILGRAEMFASKNRVLASALDGIGMGAGFTVALLLIALVRESLGTGTLMGAVNIPVLQEGGSIDPMIIFVLAPGGFFVYGLFIALAQKLGKEKVDTSAGACGACPAAAVCSKASEKEGKKA
ncbi:MAG: electron transport complex subunit E [Oscillospiraceae bacterium]|jgi:electron transport complex protein RnfE|nr:electron transport complex subunit E [Oscillospiraceae bacterium]